MDLALFDFDGTITHSDSFTAFVRAAVPASRRLTGRVLLAPVVLGYRLGVVRATTARQAVCRVALGGVEARALDDKGRAFATDVLPGLLRAEAVEALGWHRDRGDEVAVVSASLDVYLQPWCERSGFVCVCTELERRDGVVTGRYAGGDCTGVEKARRVRRRFDLARYQTVFAYGDTPEDAEMLALAHHRTYRWSPQRGPA